MNNVVQSLRLGSIAQIRPTDTLVAYKREHVHTRKQASTLVGAVIASVCVQEDEVVHLCV